MHVTSKFIQEGHQVASLDSMSPSYGGGLSYQRSEFLLKQYNHKVLVADINSLSEMELLSTIGDCDLLVHLAAWPGVRQGQEIPTKYSLNNVIGFSRIIAAVHTLGIPKFLFSSSSSVYGDLGLSGPVREEQATGLKLKSHYAVNKWMNELEARSYSEVGQTSITALRFFTAYGPWGRPDMAYWTFLENILSGRSINLFGENGGMRNFTYITELVDIVYKLAVLELQTRFQAVNVTCGAPIETLEMLMTLQKILGAEKLEISRVSRPSEDVEKTWANLDLLSSLVPLPAPTPIYKGLENFSKWYMTYYG